MKSRLGLALLGLRLSAILYYLVMGGCTVGSFFLPADVEWFFRVLLWLMAGVALGFAVFLEIVIANLKRHRFWAWVAGVAVGAIYVPSVFLPLGVMILLGLLAGGTRAAFGMAPATPPELPPQN